MENNLGVELPKRFGMPKRKLKILQITITLIQTVIIIGSLIALIVSISELSDKGIIASSVFLILPIAIRTFFPLKRRYFELTDQGVRQGKTIINWEEVIQVVKTIISPEPAVKTRFYKPRRLLHIEGKDKTLTILLPRKRDSKKLIETILNKTNLGEVAPDLESFECKKFTYQHTLDKAKITKVWRNEDLYKKIKEAENAPKPFPMNLEPKYWSTTIWRIYGAISALIVLGCWATLAVFIVTGGGVSVSEEAFLFPLINFMIAEFLLFLFLVVASQVGYWKALLLVAGLVLAGIFASILFETSSVIFLF